MNILTGISLILAQHMTGDTQLAIETEKRAISLIPQRPNEASITEMQNNLHIFETAINKSEVGN